MTQGWLFYVNMRVQEGREAHLVGIARGQEKGQKASRMKIEGSKFSPRDYNNDSLWVVCKSGQFAWEGYVLKITMKVIKIMLNCNEMTVL